MGTNESTRPPLTKPKEETLRAWRLGVSAVEGRGVDGFGGSFAAYKTRLGRDSVGE